MNAHTITILRLWAFEGPNIFSPQPGVAALLRAPSDLRAAMLFTLKTLAQRTGSVVGYLSCDARRDGDMWLLAVQFACPEPAIGTAIVRVAAELLMHSDEEDRDDDDSVWDVQRMRRAQALPVGDVQLLAEAAARGVPAFRRADGAVQVGYGAAGWSPGVGASSSATASIGEIGVGRGPHQMPVAPWAQLGSIPIYAVTGGPAADTVAMALVEGLRRRGGTAALLCGASFAAVRAALADASVTALAVSLDAGDVLRRGLPFAQCTAAAALALPAAPPDATAQEWAQATALPLLVCARAFVSADEPALGLWARHAARPPTVLFQQQASAIADLMIGF